TKPARRKAGYEKIRYCIDRTKQDGLEYFWLHTRCVEKRNKAELLKALPSMFRWYANAQ
ncbi:hypothetical protein M433DRAFT_55781, partial [Acidomyces richmondensis BFW]